MSDIYHDLQFTQETTVSLEVVWEDSDAVPITSIDSAQMQLKTNRTDSYADRLLALTTAADGGIVLDASAGKLTITITDEQTAALPAGVCFYDLILEQTGGAKHVLLAGSVTVEQGVTTWQ